MYFTPGQARKVVERMHRVQREGGWLFVGASELLHLSSAPYATTHERELVAFRKKNRRPVVAAATPFKEPVAESAVPARTPEAVAPVEETRAVPAQQNAEELVVGARWMADQGKLAEALRCCDLALAADACNISAHYLRAVVLQEQGRMDEAVLSLRQVLFLDPHFVLGHVALGAVAHERGDAAGASRHLHHALEILEPLDPAEAVPDGEGLTALQLLKMVRALVQEEASL
jgi:chemotaxis protein methyltransferase CheR